MSTGAEKIPSKDVKLQNRLLADELEQAFRRVAFDDAPVLGRELRLFEEEFAAWLGVQHCAGVANGTDALIIALRALGIGPGDEVLVPSNTYAATVLAVVEVGARPVLVEPREADHNIDPAAAAAAIGPRTRAILPVHLYGLPAEIDALAACARSADLALIEDAAQAHGAALKGVRCGALGTIGCFSFHPSKNLAAIGDAGALVTSDPRLAERVRRLRDFGKSSKYRWAEPGYNSKMNTLQAAFLRVKLAHVERWNVRRRELATRYQEGLSDTGLILPPAPGPECEPCWHLYVVRPPGGRRDALQAALAERNIRCGIHYPVPPHLQPAFAAQGWRR